MTSSPAVAAEDKSAAGSAVTVEDLHKSFAQLEVLKGVSLTAREGDVVSIIGASGSGKSTFLRCINLLELPSQGRITVSGEEVKFKPPTKGNLVPADMRQVERIRTKLGMVFQRFNLWAHMTVLQNVMEAPVHVLKLPKARGTGPGRADPQPGRPVGQARSVSGIPFRRPATACSDCQGARHRPERHAVRRTDIGA